MKAPLSRKSLMRKFSHGFYRALRGIVVIQDSPHRIAWGVAIGTFVAYLPIVGIQMVVGAVICKLLRANVIASLPMAWITNPLTMVPIYYLLYIFGGIFTNDSMSYAQMEELVRLINEAGIFTKAGLIQTIDLFSSVFWPMLIGGVIVGVVNAVIFYFLTLKFVAVYQLHRSKRRAEWRNRSEHGHATSVKPESQEPPQ